MIDSLKAGAGKIKITPPIGIEIAGWGFGKSKGVLDDLYASALVIETIDTQIAIITTDLIGIECRYVSEIRRMLQRKTGINSDHILISSTHTHSGPAAVYLRRWGKVDRNYIEDLKKHLMEVVTIAYENLTDARLGVNRGMVNNVSVNRRIPGGPIDPEVGVIRIDDFTGRIIACLVNFSCHPISLHGYKNLISSDFPGSIREIFQRIKGEDKVVLYTSGACGDINPAEFKGPGSGNPALVRKMGIILGCKTLEVVEQIKTSPQIKLAVRSREVKLPLMKPPSSMELRRIIREGTKRLESVKKENESYNQIIGTYITVEWARELLRIIGEKSVDTHRSIEIQVVRLNELALVAIPGEVFVEIGLNIKRTSRAKYTFIIEAANGCIGYIPTRQAFERGGYEATGLAPKVYDIYSLAPEAEEIIKRTSIELISEIFNS